MEQLFASAARVAVLRVFVLDPTRAYYQRQLEAVTGVPVRGVQRELERLAAIELVYRHREGNRAYYQIDRDFPLYPDLRSMILKASGVADRLRADLTIDPAVRLAFLHSDSKRVLVVAESGTEPHLPRHDTFELNVTKSAEFLKALEERADELSGYLRDGEDLLGRRDDVIWRRIEAAGFEVRKGRGVA